MKPVTRPTAAVGWPASLTNPVTLLNPSGRVDKRSAVHHHGHAGVRWTSRSLVVNPTGFVNKAESRIEPRMHCTKGSQVCLTGSDLAHNSGQPNLQSLVTPLCGDTHVAWRSAPRTEMAGVTNKPTGSNRKSSFGKRDGREHSPVVPAVCRQVTLGERVPRDALGRRVFGLTRFGGVTRNSALGATCYFGRSFERLQVLNRFSSLVVSHGPLK